MTVPLSRRRASARAAARQQQREIDATLAELQAERDAEYEQVKAARKAAREAEADRPKLTADDVRGHVAVRDEFGWHRIVRVNAKSVTVETPYSWTDRIPLSRVLEARS
ncbi:hypothetical protein [Aeromicrobium sp. CTD01-1L150]|uniref:hypothetical protein n=1 Tax=Aeromicrobium sp. CTD01-1L150 TaxID=3341830 RepID=UPI0035C04A89